MNRRFISILITAVIILFSGCEKLKEPLILDQDYLQVADVHEYCQGPCQRILDWEDKPVWVKGFVPEVENDSILNEYKKDTRFYLTDIRNGMFIEIRVGMDEDAIFQFLSGITKQDQLFIRGISESILANQGPDCMKGVVVVLSDVSDMNINLE